MSESDNTKELDSYGVWVKTPPKTVDSSATEQTDTAADLFNIDTDLPDFSSLDVIEDSANTDDYDNQNTALSAEELSAIAGVTSDAPDMPEEESDTQSSVEEEISLDEFITDGIFETGPEDKNSEPEAAEEPAPAPAETESVDLSDFGFDDSIEPETEETPAQEEDTSFAAVDNDDIFNLDLSFDDGQSQNISESSGFTVDSPATEETSISADSPAGTEDVDLSEFGLSDFNDLDSSEPADTSADDGMESVDLSEFGFEDTDSSSDPVNEEVKETPVEEGAPVAETAVTEDASDDFTVSADEDNLELEPDTVTETTPSADFAPAEDDFDVNALLGDVKDENGNTVSLGDQEENTVKEIEDIPSEEPVIDVPEETIEDFTDTDSTIVENETMEIPDSFDEETAALFDSHDSSDVETSEFAESIKAPILEEMETSAEQPSTQMTAIFSQIVNELSSLKDEIASLKNDLSEMKSGNIISQVNAPAPAVDETAGFFSSTDEDDTIALSNDELDNILNTASFATEETVTAEQVADETVEGEPVIEEPVAGEPVIEEPADETIDEIEPDAELPEGIEIPAENEISIPDEDFNDETEYDVDFSNEGLEEPSLDEVDYSAVNEDSDLPEEISVPKSEDMIVESSSSDFMGSFNADDVNTDHENLSAGSSFEEEVSPEDIAAFADFDKEDPSISETLTDDKINYLSADSANELSEEVPLDVPAEEIPVAEEKKEELPDDLKTEIKSVLSYMDQLLENLPEEKIAEFAQSEQFDTYKKLFKELGLA